MKNTAKRKPPASAERELVLTRVLDAPRERVFRAWIDPEQAAQWWGPQGFTVVCMEMDVRPGGAWRKCMRSPDGTDFWRHGVYRQVVPPERLVFTYFSDDLHTTPSHETLVTVTFAVHGNGTLLTLRHAAFESAASRDAHQGGWTSALERCAEFVAVAA